MIAIIDCNHNLKQHIQYTKLQFKKIKNSRNHHTNLGLKDKESVLHKYYKRKKNQPLHAFTNKIIIIKHTANNIENVTYKSSVSF